MQPFHEMNLDRRLDATLLDDRYDIPLYIFFAFPSLVHGGISELGPVIT